ncbi:type III secretion system inner membrane ring subunit SctD [Erwinia pyrifoliae]|uniref:type III secretion system inner membrane ring subunit SctD n=1 Tax=Erwinia pyrifoliae TaxID=79967 RepID=UPI0001961208|nr:type III secretion system inner membrane ring subunit SctD [Erwinia pyrifoliae]AUX71527.1 EscD/YscD/HrpQ family type III secretion system inner membrane ring protein [Erwinia pyrifoliae]MCA8878253.1 EscD/YscD/HrpQ family type III secretion system inner membrane ring protein [Erwinia pyrifoliae]UWS29851.1 type III secretion system inner membrane ring subunit SctD [Erwinia pyrifoliae]UXK12864.1 type III secretion system inner membrane ring subunit SctD [Erwinia pyrifoliae]CAX56867.1 hrp/hrc T
MHELRVLTGLHRGAALPLSGLQWWIGAAQDADLALFDPGIKDRHCQLSKTDLGWQVTALEGPLNDNEGQRCEQLTDLQPGTAFAIGHIWLSIVSAATPWPEEADEPLQEEEEMPLAGAAAVAVAADDRPAAVAATREKRPLPLWAKAVYLLLSLLLVMMLGGWLLQDSIASPSAPPAPGKPLLSSVERTRQVVTSMLLDRGLDRNVTLSSDSNSLTLSGSISSEDNQRLERMLANLYQRFDVKLPIHNRATTVSSRLPFNIVQISSGPRANIVTADGQRIFIGDEIDQLRLVAINADSLEFAGRENIRVKW